MDDLNYHDDAKSIAARYGVSAKHITNLATAGTIPGLFVGAVRSFNREEIHAAILEHT